MPKDGDPLPSAQVALLRSWIDQGASWPQTGAKRSRGRSRLHRKSLSTGPIADPRARRCRTCSTPTGCARPSIASSSRASRKKACTPSADAPLETLSGGCRSTWSACRRHRPKLMPCLRMPRATARTPRMRGWSIACSPRRITESDGRARGSISRDMPTRRAIEKDLPRVMWKYRDWVINALNQRHAVRSLHDRTDRRRHAAQPHHRSTDRQRLPPQRDDQRRRRHRSRRGALRDARRSRQHDRDGLAGDDARDARSATTTSTIPSRRRTTTG